MLAIIHKHLARAFFRACVTLKRILSVLKRPAPRPTQARKAAGYLVTVGFALASVLAIAAEPIPMPLRDDHTDPEFQFADPQGDWVRPIGEVGTWIAPTDDEGGIPSDHAAAHFNREPVIEGAEMVSRPWLAYAYFWTAPATCHRPLYFEEPNLERYGHSAGCLLQPAISGAHFFTNLAVLPYKMGQDRCHECIYTLGHYRPGSCAPWQTPDLRVEPDAIFFEGLAVTGIVLLIP
jgi:hypothetical protein